MVGVDISSFGYEEGHSFDVVAETGVAQRSVAYFIDQFQLQLNSKKTTYTLRSLLQNPFTNFVAS